MNFMVHGQDGTTSVSVCRVMCLAALYLGNTESWACNLSPCIHPHYTGIGCVCECVCVCGGVKKFVGESSSFDSQEMPSFLPLSPQDWLNVGHSTNTEKQKRIVDSNITPATAPTSMKPIKKMVLKISMEYNFNMTHGKLLNPPTTSIWVLPDSASQIQVMTWLFNRIIDRMISSKKIQ